MRAADLQVGSGSIRDAPWAQRLLASLRLSCHVCVAAFFPLSLSLSPLMEMFLVSHSLSLPGDADAQEPASSLRGERVGGGRGRSHAGAFVHVSVCSGMHRAYIRECVRVCVALGDDSVGNWGTE